MSTALAVDRLQFAFTVTFHYIFPQLTMGLALLLVVLKTLALRTGNEHYNRCARFWVKIFAINFAMGMVTGIPMEFQFGTNWAKFSRAAGGVLGQTLAMEGVFSFFLESTFLGLLVFGEKRLGPRLHWLAAVMVFAGSWLSGFFIIATDAWMQYPVGYTVGANGDILLRSFQDLIFNPWTLWQYLHNMIAAVVTASFVMAAVGAFYLLSDKHNVYGRTFVRVGVTAGFLATLLMLFPTGDRQGKMIAQHQPVTLAAMEGLFESRWRVIVTPDRIPRPIITTMPTPIHCCGMCSMFAPMARPIISTMKPVKYSPKDISFLLARLLQTYFQRLTKRGEPIGLMVRIRTFS